MEGPTYIPAESDGPLRQGELLSCVEQYIVKVCGQAPDGPVDAIRKMHPFAIVLGQDCDLAQDFAGRNNELQTKLQVPNVLMCEVDLAENLKRDSDRIARGSDIWKRVVQNKDDRFQYLREVTSTVDAMNEGIPALLIDFKRTFTLPTDVLYEQLKRITKRRTVLASPYREHLSFRYAHFIARVALPIDHHN